MRLGLLFLLLARPAVADEFPKRPDGVANFVVDEALLLDDHEEFAVNRICRGLMADRRIPIVVVTIPSLAFYKAPGPIGRYAHVLFDHWGIGTPERNLGMLLLVARGDRKARIELGAGWGRGHDGEARDIMQELIIPEFKRGRFGPGIIEGVAGLARMARGETAVPIRVGHWLRVAVLVMLILLAVYLAWRGAQDGARAQARMARWARRRHRLSRNWRKRQAYRDRRDRVAYGKSSADEDDWTGGAYAGSGGTFGGGSSGGGGATGSW